MCGGVHPTASTTPADRVRADGARAQEPHRRAGDRTFADDEALIAAVLAEVICGSEGEPALALHERAVLLARRARDGDEAAADELAALVAGLELGDIEVLVRSLTRWFQLLNLVEDNERVRRLRRRAAGPDAPVRRGSVDDAVRRLAAGGTSAEHLRQMLAAAELRLVMTAHPTEARRRTTIAKLARIFAALRSLDERATVPEDEEAVREGLAVTVQELWGSDEVRAVSLTVDDEVHGGLVHFTATLADVVPRIYRDLERAVRAAFPGEPVEVPSLLTFGSWMGGDRDGNPNVTPQATVRALGEMRGACLRFLERRMGDIAGRVSLSARLVGEPEALRPLLEAGADDFPALAETLMRRNPEEPYRRALSYVRERLAAAAAGAPGGYARPADCLADLRVVEGALRERGGAFVARGDLLDFIRQVEVFGFHFARLDVREHANRHRDALADMLDVLGVHPGYADLGDAERAAVLARLIADRRPLIPADLQGFAPATREVVETFRMLRAVLTGAHAGAVQAYIISGAGVPCDLLEVLLLMKESGLARAGGEDAMLRIVPLFEAGDTLRDAAATMHAVLQEPVYRAALRAVGDEQEVMIGYSDSNKDVGYVASGWATYGAQVELAKVFADHGVTWMFFHGRGGAVGRGGGRANVAIMAQPAGTVAGRFKLTEQGEVLTAKFSVPEIAHRELELIASAVLVSTLESGAAVAPERRERYHAVMAGMAERSTAAYRELVYGDPDFVAFFHAVTPVQEISRLRLGSRPARRGGAGSIEGFRAIPWVFSWTQSRIVLPAWYGLGTALSAAAQAHGFDVLRDMRDEWPFFAALLSNAEMACAKADLHIGRRYAALCEDAAVRERIWGRIEAEFEAAREHLVRLSGGRRLLDGEPVLRDSIDRRNPYVDPLSFVQIELLRRARAGEGGDRLARTSFLAINGIASGLRNTG